jgi:hypothetical protein
MVMKKTIFLFIAAILLLSCCTRGRYSARLVAADSLMNAHPDSAYAILKSISSDTLPSKGDRAYYALLFTQAMYKNYDTIRSDSLINIAVNYFSDNYDREKYTRSLIFKGCALSDMNKNVEAIQWLLMAENNAPENDYFHLGYAVYKMGDIYRSTFCQVERSIEKYKKALSYYKRGNNKKFELSAASMAGGMYRITNLDSAYKYLNLAILIANGINDSAEIFDNTEMLAGAFIEAKRFKEAKDTLLYIINKGEKFINKKCLYDLSCAYAKLGNLDSANYYYSFTNNNRQNNMVVTSMLAKKEISNALGNYKSAMECEMTAENKADSMENVSLGESLVQKEKAYELQKAKKHTAKIKLIYVLLSSLLLLSFLLTLVIWLKKTRNKKIITAQRKNIDDLNRTINNQIETMKNMINCYYENEKNTKIISAKLFESINLKNKNNNFWKEIRLYVDANYNNIITRLLNNYNLDESDISLIELYCCNFTSSQIAVCMSYKNFTSVGVRKIRIMKKIGDDMKFEDFMQNLIKNDNK